MRNMKRANSYINSAIAFLLYIALLGPYQGSYQRRMDPKAAGLDDIPVGWIGDVAFKDKDGDGDMETYLQWINTMGDTALICLEKGAEGFLKYPNLEECAFSPFSAKLYGVDVTDYADSNFNEKLESMKALGIKYSGDTVIDVYLEEARRPNCWKTGEQDI
jgi:hypothetical protein